MAREPIANLTDVETLVELLGYKVIEAKTTVFENRLDKKCMKCIIVYCTWCMPRRALFFASMLRWEKSTKKERNPKLIE